MTLTITIADNTDAQRVLDGLCEATDYDAGSGQTKGEWMKDKIIQFLRSYAKRGENKINSVATSTAIDAIVFT